MNAQTKKIEVRFAEPAEFKVTPADGWVGSDECVQDRQ
jgi:hypothetical protein